MPKLDRNLFIFRHVAKKNYKIFAERSISLNFERKIANEWRKSQKFYFNENTTGFRPQVISSEKLTLLSLRVKGLTCFMGTETCLRRQGDAL